MLLTTPEGIARARKRLAEDIRAKETIGRLLDAAKTLDSDPLPIFDKDWWRAASTRRWQEIYPEVSEHTFLNVRKPCHQAWQAAIAHAITQDESLAQTVQRVLLHYANYEFFAVHPDVGMNWSIWLMHLLQAYDIVRETVCPDGAARIDEFFESALAAVRRNDEWWVRDNMGGLFNNHLAWHKLFIGSYGIYYDRPKLVDYAINSNQAIRELIENGTRDDGLWFESSINYHYAAVVPLVEMARQLSNSGSGFDLWNRHFANGRNLRDLVTGPIQTLFPDETLPTIGDCYTRRARIDTGSLYYLAYDAYRLPEIAWVLRKSNELPADALFLEHLPPAECSPPQVRTRAWPEHGYVFLRADEGASYWQGSGFSAFVSRDLDSVHSHRDKLGLMVFGRGAHLAVDVEAASTHQHTFSSRIMAELNRSTICHNTVMVDGQDHNPVGTKLDLVHFIDEEDVKLATVADESGRVCPGVAMMRTVATTRDYVLDIFQVASESEHTYDYLFHTYSDRPDLEIDGHAEPFELPDGPPWKWLRDANAELKDRDWHADAVQANLQVRLSMLGCRGTQVITCRFPAKDDFSGSPTPMLIARRKAEKTVFVTVLQAERGRVPPVAVSLQEDRHGLLRIGVTVGEELREFSVRRL